MKKDTIFQFVGFVTNLDFEEFVTKWEPFAKRFMHKNVETTLQELDQKKGKFNYVSQHQWSQDDFQFEFMEGKKGAEHFPEHTVKVVQAGGYTPMQIESGHNEINDLVKVMAFTGHNENDIDFYKKSPSYRYLNIYEAYYESCTYAYIMEFFVEETQVEELMLQLKTRTGIETSVYKECPVLHA
ncbi:MAG: hypothetical protein JJE22_12650 [Bacteroidia bacterium]|nr:hypothetical protein [Bacteroidia bacterium]